MVQKKVPGKVFIQADNVKSAKHLANLSLSSSHHQDGKGREVDMKKKMKSTSIRLSELKALQLSPSKGSFFQPEKPPPLRVPTMATSPQKQQRLMRTTGESPHYMKSTCSLDAKKELFTESLRNTQLGSYYKNQRPNISSYQKASTVSDKKPAKALTRSSSSKKVRTITKNPITKPLRACPRKSSRAALSADVNAQRTTCSSSLKDPKFPAYLMLNPGGTESEGTSVMQVCPYLSCSLNAHCDAPLPPFKSFLSASGRILKSQKTMNQEALGLRRLKVPIETKDSDIGQIVIDSKPGRADADIGFFIEVYAKVKEDEAKSTEAGHEDKIGKFESSQELQCQEDIESTIEDNSMDAREDIIKQAIASMSDDDSPESQINFEEDFKKYCDDVITESCTMGSFLQDQNADFTDVNHPPSCSHEDTSMGSCCSKISNDKEQLDSNESDGSHPEATDKEWEEGTFCTSKHEEEVVSAVLTDEKTKSKESLSKSSLEVSVILLDDKINNCYKDILGEEALQEVNAEKCACFRAQPHGIVLVPESTDKSIENRDTEDITKGISCNQCSLIEEVFQDLTNSEENGGKYETFEYEVDCATRVLNEALANRQDRISLKDSNEALGDRQDHISLKDGASMPGGEQIYNTFEEQFNINQVKSEGSRNLEIKNTEIYQDVAKLLVESNGNGILGHKLSEPCKIDETNEDRNSSLETNDGSNSQVTQNQLIDVHDKKISAAQDHELLEKNEDEANKSQSTSCTGGEEQKTSTNCRGSVRCKIPVNDDKELRKFNQRQPHFLPLIPDPEPEKVILKHHIMDGRKSADEWMLDYALRKAVTKLAPVRKTKVALLVEAFETVMSIPKWQTHTRNDSASAHARTIQA